MIQGDEAEITVEEESGGGESFIVENGSKYIKLSGKTFDFSKMLQQTN